MNGLETLVPPRDLCEKIPSGRFAHSALVWAKLVKKSGAECFKVVTRDDWCLLVAIEHYPAPTVQEIMDELGKCGLVFPNLLWQEGRWEVTCEEPPVDEHEGELPCIYEKHDKDNPATAALKIYLWLMK